MKTEDYLTMSEERKQYNQHKPAGVDPQTVQTTDPVVLKVIHQLDDRSQVGLLKYKEPLSEDSRSTSEWVQMALEECLDMANYLQKLKMDLEDRGL